MIRHFGFLLVLVVLLTAGCGDSDDEPSGPTPRPSEAPSPTVILAAPTQTPGGPTLTASPTVPPTITPTNTLPPPPPSATPTATETPGPIEYTVETGDDCISITYKAGHNDLDVIPLFLQLNSLTSCNALPGPGAKLLVPRPTPTATPAGMDLTQTAVATSAPPMVTLDAPAAFSIQPYTVVEGDTLMSIALSNESSMRQICELNQGILDCRGCKWENANCCCPNPPLLSVGQQVNIPAPTPTPTMTPTLSGSETPTMTPTYRAPQPIAPMEGANVVGPVRLMWLSVGALAADEYYLVTVRNEGTGEVFSDETRQLSLDVPQSYLPDDGQSRLFSWQVAVVQLGADGLLYPAGSAVAPRQFTWLGWQQP
jgi:hypothetical protein